jgi:hypothetical protein
MFVEQGVPSKKQPVGPGDAAAGVGRRAMERMNLERPILNFQR